MSQCVWFLCCGLPAVFGGGFVVGFLWFFLLLPLLVCVGGVGVVGVFSFFGFGWVAVPCFVWWGWLFACGAFLESLILAQDERWRRA